MKTLQIPNANFTTENNTNNNMNDDLGAAGLWARNVHPSFQGLASPVIKIEPDTSRRISLVPDFSPLVTNGEEFVCSICEMFIIEEQGVDLQNCRHNFCRPCLTDAIVRSPSMQIFCPLALTVAKCEKKIRFVEIKALLPAADFEKFLLKPGQPPIIIRNNAVPALMDLETNFDYVENNNKFDCPICLTEVNPGDGVRLKNCLHEYCKRCLGHHIEHSEELEVSCPFVFEGGTRCEGKLQDRELRSLITAEVFSARLAKSLLQAEAVIKDSFHCKTPDCPGWVELCPGVISFYCPVCGKGNCIACKAVHEGKSCDEFYFETHADERKARDDGLTNAQLKNLITLRQAMPCPGCGVVIQKTTGCNHMKCTRCQRDFQWQGLD